MKRLFLGLVAAASLALGVAIAQVPGIFITNMTGLEQINVINAGPQITTITTGVMRNTTGYLISTTATGTATPTPTSLANNYYLTAALTGPVTINLPASPPDGQLFSVVNGTGSAFTQTITVAATDGSTIANGATAVNLAAAASEEWQYTVSSRIWYRQR